jgi:sucrose-phosphate synthase
LRIAFINPQGNFDPKDSYWGAHPDFGGQLVYVKEVACACADLGHHVDIITRLMEDPNWPEFASSQDTYPDQTNLKIIRIPFGGPAFLNKEELWPYLGTEFVAGIKEFYRHEGYLPDFVTTHYGDGGITAAVLNEDTGIPFTFTAHSLGAQKMEKLAAGQADFSELEKHYHFSRRIFAERVAMNHSAVNIVSSVQERMEQYAHPAYRNAIDASDEARFAVIPPGVNLKIFDHSATYPGETKVQDRIRSMFERDLAHERRKLPAIVSSSRLDSKKNLSGLVAAFGKDPQLQDLANLVIFVRGLEDPLHEHSRARGEERIVLDEIVSIIERYSLWGKVSAFPIAGQNELAAAYRYLSLRHSVFALTALYEPFGLAPLEAIAAGLPGVVTKNGGPSESLYDPQTGMEFGVLVDPADHTDISQGLVRVLSNSQTWDYYHQAGIKRVYDCYTWEQTAKGYLKVIESLLKTAQHPGTGKKLPIPAYFRQPLPENDFTLEELTSLLDPKTSKH